MAGANLLSLLDDIAVILDDVAVMTKLATKRTAGVLGDDLALNAQQVTGVSANRELPVVWAVAKGSALNKVILVPIALAINVFLPGYVTTGLLMVGGAFLCFEGAEKVVHKLFHKKEERDEHDALLEAAHDAKIDLVAFERDKIKGAIRTDFILSAEIIVISLGAMVEKNPDTTVGLKLATLIAISVIMTVGVYGLVAIIVKLDDAGLYLSQRESAAAQGFGKFILFFAPLLMKTLGIVGTIAMFLVGGGIIAHGTPPIHHFVQPYEEAGLLSWIVPPLINGITGLITGLIILAIVSGVQRARGKKQPAAHASS